MDENVNRPHEAAGRTPAEPASGLTLSLDEVRDRLSQVHVSMKHRHENYYMVLRIFTYGVCRPFFSQHSKVTGISFRDSSRTASAYARISRCAVS